MLKVINVELRFSTKVLFKNVNMDNVQKHINNAQKAVGLIQELTKKNAPTIISKTPRPITKFFGD